MRAQGIPRWRRADLVHSCEHHRQPGARDGARRARAHRGRAAGGSGTLWPDHRTGDQIHWGVLTRLRSRFATSVIPKRRQPSIRPTTPSPGISGVIRDSALAFFPASTPYSSIAHPAIATIVFGASPSFTYT